MPLMLAVMFMCVALGLLARRFGARQHLAVVVLAIAMTVLYLFLGERFV